MFSASSGPIARASAAGVVVLLLLAVTAVVYLTGGTKAAYGHLAYLPVLLGGLSFGAPGGALVGLMMGFMLGPFMPLDVDAGAQQSTFNWVVRSTFFVGIGSIAGFVCSVLKRELERARHHGFHDPVTKLPNRAKFVEDLGEVIRKLPAGNSVTSIVAGLSDFGQIERSFGHAYADALRAEAARRLQLHNSDHLPLYDLGQGQYATFLRDGLHDRIISVGHKLSGGLGERFVIDHVPLLETGHFGVARYPQHADGAFTLKRASMIALHEAIAERRPYATYDEQRDLQRRATKGLLAELESALVSGDQLDLHYQPKVHIPTGTCLGAEALLRWNHPDMGGVAPSQFIEAVENTALIKQLTERVLDIALLQSSTWADAGLDITIGVNVSVRNLENREFPRILRDLLKFHGTKAASLQLEITETAFMRSKELIHENLSSIREIGVGLALDDFGVGHSSLAYLRDLPIDELKLDRSFVSDLLFDRRTQIVVEKTIETAHSLGFRIVAEGIEHRSVYERLREMSCDFGQGYLFARPMPAAEFEDWLQSEDVNGRRTTRSASGAAGRKALRRFRPACPPPQ